MYVFYVDLIKNFLEATNDFGKENEETESRRDLYFFLTYSPKNVCL